VDQIIQTIAVYAIPVLLAITLHEAAHGYVARMFGDHTAAMLGRITLNPLKHIDPIGTIAVPLLILFTSKAVGGPPLLFGWAKPVPVNFGNLRNPKRDMIPVAGAGPVVNLLMAIAWAILGKILTSLGVQEPFFIAMCQAGVMVNIGLMALNLLPLPPLDGGRILVGLLPHNAALAVARIEPFGMWILILLLVTGTLSFFVAPFWNLGFAIVGLFS
jgi:Zn-dependent protease